MTAKKLPTMAFDDTVDELANLCLHDPGTEGLAWE